MRNLIFKLRSSSYVGHISRLVKGNVLAQLIAVIALPVLSRIYTPEDFGSLTVFSAFGTFAAIGVCLRFESALLISTRAELSSLRQLCIAATFLSATVFSGLLAVLLEFDLMGYGILQSDSIYLMWFFLAGMGLFAVARALALRFGDSRLIASSRVFRSGVNAVSKIGFGFLSLGPLGLLVGEALGAWAANLRMARAPSTKVVNGEISLRRMRSSMRRYAKFPSLELPSVLINQLAIALPAPMLASVSGAAAAGYYGVARLAVALPNLQVGTAVADTFQLRASELVRSGNASEIRPLLRKTMLGLLLAGSLPNLLIALVAPTVFPWVLGSDWVQAGIFASLIVPWVFGALVVGSLGRLLSVLQRQELKLIYDFFSLGMVLGCYILATWIELSATKFLASIVSANVIAYVIYYLILLHALRGFESAEATG